MEMGEEDRLQRWQELGDRQRVWVVADQLSRRNGRKETPRGLPWVSAWQ